MATRIPIPLGQQRQQVQIGMPVARTPMVAVEDRTGQAVAGGFGQVADSWKRVEEEGARAWVSKSGAQAQLDWMQRLGERQSAAQPGAAGFVDGIRAEYQQYREEALANAPANVRRYYEAKLDDIGSYVESNAIRFQASEKAAYTRDLYQQGIASSVQVASQDPSQYDSLIASQRALLGASELPPSMRTELIRGAEREISYAAEFAKMRADPSSWLGERAPTAFGLSGGLPAIRVSDAVRRYQPVVETAASAAGVDPRVMLAQLQAESGGNPNAVSPKGAAGIAQFMPDTATRYKVNPNDPESSIRGQAAYMRDLLEMFDGDYAKALAGYNWGEGNVQKAVRKYGASWLERAPKETKDYVGKILGGEQPQEPGTAARVGSPAFDALPLSDQQRLIERATTLSKQNQAFVQAQIQDTVRDATSSILATGEWNGPQLTRASFIHAYGASEGAARWDGFQSVQQLGTDIQDVKALSAADQDALLAVRRPDSGPGYTDAQKRYELLESAVATVRKQRDADPAYSATQSSEQVRDAYLALATSGQSGAMGADLRAVSSDYAVKAMAEQRRLGVSNPRILPQSEIKRVSNMLQQHKDDSEDTAVMISMLEQQWGAHWPKVFSELAGSGGLPDAALVIPNIDDQGVRERIARTATIDEKTLKTRLPEHGVRDVEDELATQMADAWNSFVYQGGGPRNYQVVYDTARKLALSYAAGGIAPKKAALQAYQEVMGNRYEFGDTYRVPRAERPDEVMPGIQRVLQDLNPEALALPVSLAGLPGEAAKNAYLDVVRNRAVFVTNRDESGLDLYVLGENGLSPVLALSGEQVSFAWGDLRGNDPISAGSPYIGYRKPGGGQ